MKIMFRAFIRAFIGFLASLSIGASLAFAKDAPVPDVKAVATAPPHAQLDRDHLCHVTHMLTVECSTLIAPKMIRLDHHGTEIAAAQLLISKLSVLASSATVAVQGGDRNAEIV